MLHVIECENWKIRVRKENEAQRIFQQSLNVRQDKKEEKRESQTISKKESVVSSAAPRVSTVTSIATSTDKSELMKQLKTEKQKVQQLKAYIKHIEVCPAAKK